MRIGALIFSVTLCLTSSAALDAQPLSRVFQILRHDTNQVEMCISNYGRFGMTVHDIPGCWWPTGSGHNYIYGAGIWFGTIDALNGDTLVTTGYYPHDGTSECAPGLHGMLLSHPCARIYMYPDNWPPPADTFPMAPQEAVSHQDSWCCFNDCDPIYHIPGDTRPIGIEVYQTVYEWNLTEIQDIIFFMYDVKNVSGHTLEECYIGIKVHCRIGGLGANDRCCAIVEREYAVNGDTILVDNTGYQWQEDEEPGTPPWFPGAIGFDLLQTPFDLVEGMDKDGDGILDQYERDSVYYVHNLPQYLWDADNDGVPDWRDPSQWPQLGMTAIKRFSGFGPDTDPERFLAMAGYDFTTGQYAPYDTVPADPDYWRFLESSGPFELEPDSVVSFVFAVMFADRYDIYLLPDTSLALIDQYAEDYYNMYWYLYTGVQENFEKRNATSEMRILPNPISNSGVISFSLPTAAYVSLKLYNAVGQLVETVYDGVKPAGVYEHRLDTRSLPQGTYFVVLETGSVTERRSVVVLR